MTHLLCHPEHCHAERSRSAAKQHSGVVEASLPKAPARGGIPPAIVIGPHESSKTPENLFRDVRVPPLHRTPKLTVEPAVTF